jgi:hypothetical protein
MNQRDRDNLNFLMKATPESLAAWYAQASEDDLEYADELLERYSQELDQHLFEVLVDEDTTFVGGSTSVH